MAELEVAKNLKKAVEIAKSEKHTWKDKLKEIALEIVIIVFAVSLSIYLHSWSEHREHQHGSLAVLVTGTQFTQPFDTGTVRQAQRMQEHPDRFAAGQHVRYELAGQRHCPAERHKYTC